MLRSRFAALTLISAAYVMIGCSSSPDRQQGVLADRYHLSPNLMFHYRMPPGWQEVTPSGEMGDVRLWLASSDFRESVQIREVRMDAETRGVLREAGPEHLARLIYSMRRGDTETMDSGLVREEIGERQFWSYTVQETEGIYRFVSIFVLGDTLMECQSVLAARGRSAGVHGEFISALRW